MAAVTILAALLMSQASASTITVQSGVESYDVGASDLLAGRAQSAIERINSNKSLPAEDPAAHINLGTAYAMHGNQAAAMQHYRAAYASEERYDVELADGSIADSRHLAATVLKKLKRGTLLASK